MCLHIRVKGSLVAVYKVLNLFWYLQVLLQLLYQLVYDAIFH